MFTEIEQISGLIKIPQIIVGFLLVIKMIFQYFPNVKNDSTWHYFPKEDPIECLIFNISTKMEGKKSPDIIDETSCLYQYQSLCPTDLSNEISYRKWKIVTGSLKDLINYCYTGYPRSSCMEVIAQGKTWTVIVAR